MKKLFMIGVITITCIGLSGCGLHAKRTEFAAHTH